MPRYALKLFADYHQFYLQDEPADGDLSEAWTQEATDRLLAISEGVVCIGTVRNVDVSVTLEILDGEPTRDFGGFDHVVECSIAITSGRLVIAGCTDYFPDAKCIEVPPGTYRVRASYANLYSISPDGPDGDDRYLLQLWLSAPTETAVFKRRAV